MKSGDHSALRDSAFFGLNRLLSLYTRLGFVGPTVTPQRKLKPTVLLFLSVVCCLLAVGCRARGPSGKYVSHIHLPTGVELIETADFRSDGVCYFGEPPTYIADCRWSQQGKTITISRNGVVLIRLQFDGKQLVDPETTGLRGPFVREQARSR
jgi:hypothetical protein